ncbi:MAG TPA: NAD-dependent epimerase/dehydratase family protein [bacterium]
MKIQPCRILVTGAAGFIGAKVCEFLLTQPHLVSNALNDTNAQNAINVIGLDNLNDYYDVRLKNWRLQQLKNIRPIRSHSSQFAFHKIDIENYASLRKLFQHYSSVSHTKRASFSSRHPRFSAPFHAVINLAARAGVRYSLENPFIYYTTNILGNLNLLELCREFGVNKYVFSSSSSLYAGQKMPFKETLPVNEPISPYAASKKSAEVTCFTYHKLFNIDVTILRYFTVYGPASRPDMSPLRFISWVHQGKPITIYGDGNQSRDFTYIDDIARGTIRALKRLNFEIINLGCDEPIKLIDFLRIIEEKMNKLTHPELYRGVKSIKPKKLKIVYQPSHPADMQATWADIKKARRLLDWKPKVKIDQGIQNSVDWFFKNRGWITKIKI